MENESNEIQIKDYVILKRGNHFLLHQLNNKPRVKYFNADIDLSNIIGKPFWSTYRIEFKNKKSYTLEPCNPTTANEYINLDQVDCGVDNRNIQDDNNAQTLTKEEILGMRDSGISSQDIVQQLVKNSKTFSHKTEFAQEKYLRKKSKKYTDYIQVLKPSIRLLSEVLLNKSASTKLLGLRVDTLSQIITAVNFQPEGKYIVYENNCEGMVIATLLNLISSNGKILNIVTPDYNFRKRKVLKVVKFPASKVERLININCTSFLKTKKMDEVCVKTETLSLPNDESDNIDLNSDIPSNANCFSILKIDETDKNNDQLESESVVSGESKKRKLIAKDLPCKHLKQQSVETEEIRNLQSEKADGLIIVCREIPNKLLEEMLQFLAPSRSFVVYNQFQEPLIQLYSELRKRADVIGVRLVENWMRSYQVLPNRTHPEIVISGNGGYLLTGITVTNNS